MKLEKINTGNERQVRDYISSLTRKLSNSYSERNEKGFNEWISKFKKTKEYKLLEKLNKQKLDITNKLNDLEKSLEEEYSIDISLNSYCGDDKIKLSKDYKYDYSESRPLTKKDDKCSYEKDAELNKAILERDVATANKLISELEKKVGVQ
jgi:hypothetical protein